ncbi:hypothetical protein BAY59_08705 [Prauserella coralliicola]|nr:hypothetical protein BAY59_08705 [Prauserella coralliicola]
MPDTPPDNGGRRPVPAGRRCHPGYDNQNRRTAGRRGPAATLENARSPEKIGHRERIPERGKPTDVAVRFSTVIGGRHSEGARDRRRLRNLGHDGPREVSDLVLTHCVPDERAAVPR